MKRHDGNRPTVRSGSLPEPNDVLYRIKRALSGYISYLAACEMNQSFSEYLLYEPILRVLTARGFTVRCEAICPGISHRNTGDKKRLDLVAEKAGLTMALEVKWAKTPPPCVSADVEKLAACRRAKKDWQAFLIVFGRKSCIENLRLPADAFTERGQRCIADFGKTKYGCRIFELAEQTAGHVR